MSKQWAREGKVIKKINLRVREDNLNAMRLYERFGFVKEGLLTREFLVDGHFYSAVLMGLTL